MDYGYPLTTEPNVLKSLIVPPSVLSRITNVTIGLRLLLLFFFVIIIIIVIDN
jgi:hypothetical protein